jgi:hypothetical protein
MSRDIPKLIIGAGVLQELLAKHPEIEIELVKNGAAQVATAFAKKFNAGSQADALIQNIISRVNTELNYKYHMPPAVMKVIETVVRDNIAKYNAEQAEGLAKKYFDEAFARHSKALESKLEGMATSIVEKKVAAVFAAAARFK